MGPHYITCRFPGSYKDYVYMSMIQAKIEKGDYVIVPSGQDFAVVRVTSVDVPENIQKLATVYIVDKINPVAIEISRQHNHQ